jgi:hypothetical protein
MGKAALSFTWIFLWKEEMGQVQSSQFQEERA